MQMPAPLVPLATLVPPVIDTFCFNGEWIVPMRLAYLNDTVEAFVIVESWTTHSGVRKEALFRDIHADWFAPYATKVHWVIVEDFPDMPAEWAAANQCHAWMLRNQTAWWRESYQRDIAVEKIREIAEGEANDYLVHVSDADELPKVSLFHPDYRSTLLGYTTPVYLEQSFFYYNFHWKKPYQWYRAYILSGRVLAAPASQSFTHWRISHIPAYVAPNGGFHFSYFMTPNELQKKLAAFAHRECDQTRWASAAHIRRCIANGLDLFERPGEQLIPYDPLNDPNFPAIFVPYIEALEAHQGV